MTLMNQLINDIDKIKKINKSSVLFISHRKLYPYKIKKKPYEDHLPQQALLGSVFLIKKNNILEFYSWCECDYSIYLQISTKTSRWIGSCDIINIEDGDPENINFMFGDIDNIYTIDVYHYYLTQLMELGFKLYIK